MHLVSNFIVCRFHEIFSPLFVEHIVEKREIFSHWKKISSNHLFKNFYSKTNAFIKVSQCGKREILSHWKKFRQINYLLISLALVKPLISRNFCKKSVRENWCNFHTAHCECGKTRHSVPRNFFRQIATGAPQPKKMCRG